MTKKLLHFCAVTIWILFFATFGLTYYVNNYLPHGPSYPTGEIVCQNDDRGPCGEVYKEDMRNLNIPDWAKFLREYFLVPVIGLGILGFYVNNKYKDYERVETI